MDINAFRDVNYGMYIVSSKGEKNAGCVINTFTQLTSEDPTISVCINKNNYTNKVIREAKVFSVAVLSEEISPNIISKFGFTSSKDNDKFEDVEYKEVHNVPVVTSGVCSYFICELLQVVSLSTHDLFIAKVVDAEKLNNENPMTYKYYHEVVKGKAPKTAPTYIEERRKDMDQETEKTERWQCEICGYIHEGPLPEGFVCPVCKVDASHFKQI